MRDGIMDSYYFFWKFMLIGFGGFLLSIQIQAGQISVDASHYGSFESCMVDMEDIADYCDLHHPSCQRKCGKDDYGNSGDEDIIPPVCGCDDNCLMLGNCCPDYEIMCKISSETLTIDNEYYRLSLEDKVCMEGNLVIKTCRGEYLEPSTEFDPPVHYLRLGISFINQNVFNCHFKEKGQPWVTLIQSVKHELPTSDMIGILKEIADDKHRHAYITIPPTSIANHYCALKLIPSGKCSNTFHGNSSLCDEINAGLMNQECRHHFAGLKKATTTSPLTSSEFMSTENSSIAGERCQFEISMPEIVNASKLYFEESYKIARTLYSPDGVSSILHIRNWDTSARTHHWDVIGCLITRNESDGSHLSRSCGILACEPGYYYINGDCYIPQMLTLTIHITSNFTQSDKFPRLISLVKTVIKNQQRMRIRPLGDRMALEPNDIYAFTDHYEIMQIQSKDLSKELNISTHVFKLTQAFNEEFIAEVLVIEICFIFMELTFKYPGYRCDDVKPMSGVIPKIQDYPLNATLNQVSLGKPFTIDDSQQRESCDEGKEKCNDNEEEEKTSSGMNSQKGAQLNPIISQGDANSGGSSSITGRLCYNSQTLKNNFRLFVIFTVLNCLFYR